ncbi:MAG TPA: ribosome silencing factor [Acidimicrobiales bacterium]|jgi:ribosome-associated protein|nr:ribosome silencing factor [Acidimicrobiales bacterium]
MTAEPPVSEPTAEEIAMVAAIAADEKKGETTVVLRVGPVLAICELFVVTSASNTRLVRTLAEEVEKAVRARTGESPLRVEGMRDLQWVLLDYGDVVVHIFHEEARRFYDIERLYRDVERVAWTDAAHRRAGS